jgi:hypothetical protein
MPVFLNIDGSAMASTTEAFFSSAFSQMTPFIALIGGLSLGFLVAYSLAHMLGNASGEGDSTPPPPEEDFDEVDFDDEDW